MLRVAKIVISDNDGQYLLMYRNQHPMFGNDPDIPGGCMEDGEQPLQAVLREVKEEIGIVVNENLPQEIYEGTGYSMHGAQYSLFMAKLDEKPELTMSYEHSAYEWIDRDDFLERAKNAKDTFMHMVYDVLK